MLRLWGLAYGVWTIIHYFLQIGKGIPCDQYETEEEPYHMASKGKVETYGINKAYCTFIDVMPIFAGSSHQLSKVMHCRSILLKFHCYYCY